MKQITLNTMFKISDLIIQPMFPISIGNIFYFDYPLKEYFLVCA